MPGKWVRHPRALAAVVSALLLVLGTWILASPATAAPGQIVGECYWDDNQWVITWRVSFPAETEPYRLVEHDATPAGSSLTGFTPDQPGVFPHDPAQPLVGEQRVPADAPLAGITVVAEWADYHTETVTGQVTIPGGCQAPELPDLIGDFGFDCQWLRVTIVNPTAEAVRLTLVPSGGTPLEVEVAADESATVEFPADEGRSVDVRLDGRSVVDPDRPITITPSGWAALDCDADGGEGADLPVTGTPVLLLVGGAVILVLLGTGLYLVARRRTHPVSLD